VQRPLWASTSTKNPAYPDTLYVDNLIGGPTVQTLPQETLLAFADHGTVAPTLEQDVDGARQVFRDLEALGVSYDDITDTLIRQGVDSFSKSFLSLLSGLTEKIQRFREEMSHRQSESLDGLAPQVRQALDDLAAQDVPTRLQSRDPSLWHGERNTIAQRLGWLPVVERMLDEAHRGEFERFAGEVCQRGYERALLLGMGGSSLAPDVFSKVFPARDGYPRLIVLDTTNPDTIGRVADEVRDKHTLFIVSTKSGTTVETMSLYRFFLGQRGGNAGDFIAITDSGTPLDNEAQARGFWKIFRNPADIGGRYSALSYFGLVPAAAAGIDVEQMLVHAARLLPVHDIYHPGVWLGAVMGAAQRAGRDKLTLVTSERWAPFADWLEQLIAESTGKDGTGIIPITHEPPLDPQRYSDDRLFVFITEGMGGDGALDQRMSALRQAGHPVVRLTIDELEAIGAEFVRWEIATAVAGGMLGINPFDEANVQEAKDATNAVLKDPSMTPPPAVAPQEAAERIVGMVKPRGYLAILAYVDRVAPIEDVLQELRRALAERTGVATTLGYGPRYLHSTGQLHKGGPPIGTFLMIVQQPRRDLEIPGAEYTFARLFGAQAAGDAITLSRHGLPLIRVEAGQDPHSAIKALIGNVTARAASAADR
jgi:transaldolase/glucose-6-phosphate isomerase